VESNRDSATHEARSVQDQVHTKLRISTSVGPSARLTICHDSELEATAEEAKVAAAARAMRTERMLMRL
jgi:hypothetical protein